MAAMPAVGDAVAYVALAGDADYHAVVTAVRSPGVVDLDIAIPGCREGMVRTRVTWSDDPDCRSRGIAKPRRRSA